MALAVPGYLAAAPTLPLALGVAWPVLAAVSDARRTGETGIDT